jgi:carbon monoxide dehydrogenase subunit G
MKQLHELQHSLVVRARVEDVWLLLWDIPALAKCLPGCEEVVAQVEGKSYIARIRLNVAAFRIAVALQVEVDESLPGRLIRLTITGTDRRLKSEICQRLTATFAPLEGPGSRIDVSASIEIAGLLASLGKHLVAMQFVRPLDEFASNLQAIKAQAHQVRPHLPAGQGAIL